jgi:hypothetical protein
VTTKTIWMSQIGGAQFSDDGLYRYTLTRQLPQGHGGRALFVMLHPSTATAHVNDRSVSRCIDFAADLGYQGLTVGNVYARVTTDSEESIKVDDPVGPLNDSTLDHWISHFDDFGIVVAAWGAGAGDRGEDVLRRLKAAGPVWALGLTPSGHPVLPLFVKRGTQPQLI